MPPLLVRLNLPGFRSPEPFRLSSAPLSLAGLACAVLEEVGGFSREELDGIRNDLDRVPLTLLGELCAGQLVELDSDAALEMFLASAESPKGPAIIEVRPRDVPVQSSDEAASCHGMPPSLESQPGSPSYSGMSHFQDASHGTMHSRNHVDGPRSSPSPRYDGSSPTTVNSAMSPDGQAGLLPSTSWTFAADCPVIPAQELHHHNQARGPDSRGPFHTRQEQRQQQPHQQQRQQRPQSPQLQQKHRERSSTPESQRRPGNRKPEGTGSECVARSSGKATSTSQQPARERGAAPHRLRPSSQDAPVHIRLHQEKDDRRRRLEEARLRRLEKEEEDIRAAAHRALGRASSPTPASPGLSRIASTRTPPRIRPPLPERQERPLSSNSNRCGGGVDGSGPGSDQGDCSQRLSRCPSPTDRAKRPSNGHAVGTGGGGMGSPKGRLQTGGAWTVGSSVSAPPADASSITSDNGIANGLHSVASVSTLHGDESLSSPHADELHQLRQQVKAQQTRIDFLENGHQQALKQLRKAREELSLAQQQRHRETDKVLRLQQLISEVQVMHFGGDMQARARWEEWLDSAGAIFDSE